MRSVRRFAGFGLRRRSWRSRSDGLKGQRAASRESARSTSVTFLGRVDRAFRPRADRSWAAVSRARLLGRVFETESALRRGAARRGRRRPPGAVVTRAGFSGAPLSRFGTPRRLPAGGETSRRASNALRRFPGARERAGKPSSLRVGHDPQPGVVQEQYPGTAMCVRNVDVHVSCSSQVDAQLAAFFIDPRAK